jgi:hypothetical protein
MDIDLHSSVSSTRRSTGAGIVCGERAFMGLLTKMLFSWRRKKEEPIFPLSPEIIAGTEHVRVEVPGGIRNGRSWERVKTICP